MDWTIESFNNQYIVLRTFGKYDFTDHHKMIEDLLSKECWRSGMPIICDHRKLDVSGSSYEIVQKAATIRIKNDAKMSGRRAAIVADNDLLYGVFRQYDAIVELDIGGTFRAFRSFEEAEAWIRDGLKS